VGAGVEGDERTPPTPPWPLLGAFSPAVDILLTRLHLPSWG